MSYIGNTQQNQNYFPAVDFFSGNGSTTAFTMSRPVASTAAIQVIVSNVAQNPSDAYTVNGNTITFTSAPPSGTNNIYVYYTSPNTTVVQPSQGTVYPSSLSTGGPTWDTAGNLTLNNGAADGAQLVLKSAGYSDWNLDNYSGTLRFYNGSTVRASIDSSGRVTMPYQPAFTARADGGAQSSGVIQYNNAVLNIGSSYNASTYRFTAPIAGNYLFCFNMITGSTNSPASMYIRKNGTQYTGTAYQTNGGNESGVSMQAVIPLVAGDYVDTYSAVAGAYNNGYGIFSGFLVG